MFNFQKLLQSYNFHFPASLIAQSPATPRDSAKLLIYDRATKQVWHDYYYNLVDYLPKNSVLVLNQTKVIPARLKVIKPTGGKARILFIETVGNNLKFLSDRKLELKSKLFLVNDKDQKICFEVLKQENQFYFLKPSFQTSRLYSILDKFGETPLPPYIKNSKLKGKRLLSEYNTVFAKNLGSVAAPTASLHFTKPLLEKIKKSGVKIVYITLHVNLGTFATLSEEQFKTKKLHSEFYEIPKSSAEILNKAKRSKQPIIAVGTTVVRTLESAANNSGKLIKLTGTTDLFISEKTKLKFVDSIITNFHVPKSSLLMLVSAFVNKTKLFALYKLAIQKKYRLFSFGDGMMIK